MSVEIATFPLKDVYGHDLAIQGNVRDISESKRVESKLVHVERQSASTELAAGIRHNLNNILTGVLLPAELVQRLSDSVRPTNTDTMGSVDLNRNIQEMVELSRPRWRDETEAKGVTVEMVTDFGVVPEVRANDGELSEVTLNLIINAVDAMPEGGTVTVSTRLAGDDGFVLLTVSDTGIGMDKETRCRVFESFYTTKVDVGRGR